MERWKQFFHALLFPRLAVVLISVPVTAALLLYTFAYGSEISPVTYLAYLFSAYSLLIVCISTGKMAKGGAWQRLHRNPYIHRYLTDLPFQTHVSLYLSLGINLLFAGIKLFLGVYYRSVWFGTLAVYYGMMAMIRFVLLRHVSRAGIGQDIRAEFKYYRLCGVILLLMNSALAGVVILVVRKDRGFYYAGYLIYVVALYAFYNTITAVRDVVRYRKYQSPVLSAAKAVKLAAALVSMLALETAMLMQFDNGQNAPQSKQIMTAATGGGVCAIVFAMAVFMIVQSTKRLRKWGQERTEYTVDGGN